MFCAARIWPTPLDGDDDDDAFSIQACALSVCIGCALAPNVMVENMDEPMRRVKSPRCAQFGSVDAESSGRVNDQRSPDRDRFCTE